jgi:hypothetical protein
MVLSKLAAATLIWAAAAGADIDTPRAQLSMQQKNAAALAYVRPATECIARNVTADGRLRKQDPGANLGDLIVEAVPQCLQAVRAMIAAYDRYFGEGVGQDFFMGPYLDTLPNVLVKMINTGTLPGAREGSVAVPPAQ